MKMGEFNHLRMPIKLNKEKEEEKIAANQVAVLNEKLTVIVKNITNCRQ